MSTKKNNPSERAEEKETPATTSADTAALRPLPNIGRVFTDIGLSKRLEFRASCVRPNDLLVCDFVFENLRLDSTVEGKPKLVRKGTSTPVLIVEFPPQSFGEEAFMDSAGAEEEDPDTTGKEEFPETGSDVTPAVNDKNVPAPREPLPPQPSSRIRMSGPSRLAFSMPAEETELAFTIEAILDACRRWPMRLDVNAVPDPPRIRIERDRAFRDFWLGEIVNSNDWTEAKQMLVDTVGGEHQKRLAASARRVARRAVDALRAEAPSGIDEMLHEAVNEELDVLANKSKAFREEKGRQTAAAAIAFMATERLTEHKLGDAVFDLMKDLPFVRLIFPPHNPAYNVTALELPYRLILSPVPESRWHHHTTPVTRNGRTELWHTRLTSTEKDIGPDGPVGVRALWSDDYRPPGPNGEIDATLVNLTNDINKTTNPKPFFRMSLDPLDRLMLVALMSGFDLQAKRGNREFAYRPHTANSRRLSLSSLGALLEVEGQWDPPVPKGMGLQQWRHVASLGRDHYVRVVYRGFLCHPRHAASLVKVTERKFEFVEGSKNRVAVLRQRFFIVVRERIKTYDGKGHEFGARNLAFTDMEILTKVTPTLLAPDDPACVLNDPNIYAGPVPHRACFWPMIGAPNDPANARDFLFDMVGTDRHGDRRRFSMPLLFVGAEANEFGDGPEPNIMTRIRDAYNKETSRRSTSFGGATLCFAPPKDGAKGDPRLPTRTLTFSVARVDKGIITTDEAQFYPEIHVANSGIASIRRLLQKPDVFVDVEYAHAYKTDGFGPGNPGEVFLKFVTPLELSFGADVKSDSIGGLATPSMAILGLSRIMGPAAAQTPTGGQSIESKLKSIIDNVFNPGDFFKGAKILGGVNLAEIIQGLAGLAKNEVPKLLSRETPDSLEASFDWSTSLINPLGDKAGMFRPNAGGQTTLDMHGVVSARKDGSAPTFSSTATIVHFKVNLFGFVTIWFDRLRFSSRTGQKPDVAVDLHPGQEAVEFGGPLEFVNDIRSIIPSNGFSDPPNLNVTPSGISASYSINIPNLAVGIFALEHISLGAGFLLPFDASPAEVRFNFAERQRPFSLTVSLLGGGGFFAIGVGSDGVREIEASIEFGAALSINLGVASGSVEVKAGVYYHWKKTLVELEGYVRLHGELSVLGLISASLTFYLKLGYLKESGQSVVWGEATLEVEIEILFLSFSVSVSCRREFGGSAGDPKFIELIPDQTTWNEYCGAFATETLP